MTDYLTCHVVFSGEHIRLEYTGPDPSSFITTSKTNVVIAFAPFDFPFAPKTVGWGSSSFSKRKITHVCVFSATPDWYQNDEFFDAMKACGAFLGPNADITSYGFSMGGYGALLGAKALGATRAVAVSPQFSIDPAVVKFERRYSEQWAAMSGWKYNLSEHMKGSATEYIVLFDPLHRQDSRHEARLPKPSNYQRCLLHGVGHAGIQALVEIKEQEALFDLLRGVANHREVRLAFRSKRDVSFRYVRKVGTRLHEQKRAAAVGFMDLAKRNGFRRLIKKWGPFYP